ncbi:hypothetical protein SOPP22_10550 [Shewanella sp. OPT22]|uniref:YejL family protein n=1 Tax=Parashewanella hymeniacidonis TaxID=2807618 RepID=UPI00102224DE|nr:YejL family protein [Parashewanella hymeniacidonis]MBM7072641.1 YejL family protein [Parashewanella hymeniacidonis]RYV02262.1 hypothetical protein SOPP22_10550 [Shewanella sp. OPT22]
MAVQSKYKNEQIESIINEVLAVLDKHQAPIDLSLMVLGNSITHIIESKISEESREAIVEQFATALKQSTKVKK